MRPEEQISGAKQEKLLPEAKTGGKTLNQATTQSEELPNSELLTGASAAVCCLETG